MPNPPKLKELTIPRALYDEIVRQKDDQFSGDISVIDFLELVFTARRRARSQLNKDQSHE